MYLNAGHPKMFWMDSLWAPYVACQAWFSLVTGINGSIRMCCQVKTNIHVSISLILTLMLALMLISDLFSHMEICFSVMFPHAYGGSGNQA